MMRSAIVALVVLSSATARAQLISPFASFQPIALDTRAPPPPPLSGFLASAPLRLSLQGSVLPMAGDYPNCQTREEAAGNSVGGIPIQHYSELRLTKMIVLSGFSQLGCPIDASLGTAMTMALPIHNSIWLVFGAGIIAAPGQIPIYGGAASSLARGFQGRDTAINAGAHANVMWTTKNGRMFSIGVGTMGRGRQGLLFGGGF